MSALTTFFNLIKPAKTDRQKVSDLNSNWDTIDTEMHKPPLTVNGESPDPTTRNLYLEKVPLADNLATDIAQLVTGTFIERSTGGSAPVDDGSASLVSIKGNLMRTGYVAESLNMTVTPALREEGVDPITATIDRDTFVSYVSASGTITLTYTTAWSADPTDYGITVTGTPIAGDVITVVYVKENRGTITTATPTAFNSTGWNLYDNTAGYAKVCKYSSEYGFIIGGTYSLIDFAPTLTAERTTITVVSGEFTIPEDGYVFVTGGDATTYIYATWSDWVEGYQGDFESYTVDTIDLTEVMLNFPYGLLAVGDVRDEINLNAQRAINRVERIAYTAENLESVIESGVAYIYDTNYIYAQLETPVSTAITLDGTYTVSDHGIEFFSGTTLPLVTECLYGENLKDKLRTDVLTISGGLVNNLNSTATDKALTAAQGKVLNDHIAQFKYLSDTITTSVNTSAGNIYRSSAQTIDITSLGLTSVDNIQLAIVQDNATDGNSIWCIINSISTSAIKLLIASYTSYSNATYRYFLTIKGT